eukprot:6658901-Alexandrium_andersonii.AAC.1
MCIRDSSSLQGRGRCRAAAEHFDEAWAVALCSLVAALARSVGAATGSEPIVQASRRPSQGSSMSGGPLLLSLIHI